MAEAEARATGTDVSILRWPLAKNDRAAAERDTTGLVKLIVACGSSVGAGILASHPGEMIGQWTLAIAQRKRLSALAGLIVPYPTRAEASSRRWARSMRRRCFRMVRSGWCGFWGGFRRERVGVSNLLRKK